MLQRLANLVATSKLARHAYFLAAACIAISAIGYYFGTFDDNIHIPFLFKAIDPGLYPSDPFMALRYVHYSYFWYVFQPFVRWGVLEPVLFLFHILTTYLTFWMIYLLSDTFFRNRLASFLTVLAFIFPHIALPGFPVFEYSILNRTVVLPFLLLALVLYLRRRTFPAFFLLGVLANLHFLSAGYVLSMVLLDSILRIRQTGWKPVLGGMLLFITGALPVLLWKTNNTPYDFSLRPDVVDFASRTLQLPIYQFFSLYPVVLINDLSGIACVALWYIGKRALPSPDQRQVLRNFMLAIGLVLIVQIVTTYLLPITILLQLQISRAGVLWLILSYVCFAGWLASRVSSTSRLKPSELLTTGTLIVSPHPAAPLIILGLSRWVNRGRWRGYLSAGVIVGLMALTMVFADRTNFWKPGIYIYGPSSPWKDAQVWAKNHTPIDARFITPPQIYSFYLPDWRVFSQRSPVVTMTESLEVSFDPPFMDGWLARFNDVAPGVAAQFNGDLAENLKLTAEAYNHLSPQAYLTIARKYRADYLVVLKEYPQPFIEIYRNSHYIIYDLSSEISP